MWSVAVQKNNSSRFYATMHRRTKQYNLKKYMKYAKEFGNAGHMLPILINYMVIHHTLTWWGIILFMINPIHITYSPTYPSLETDDMHRYWQWPWQYCWGKLLLCSSSCRQFAEHQIDIVNCVHLKCHTRAAVLYLGTLIRRLNVSL